MFALSDLIGADRRPAPYEPGAEFWNDPHISRQMLKIHLSPDTEAASYRPGKIEAIAGNLIRAMGITPGDHLADLGCGPGLYCARFARRGLSVTGIDRSEHSIAYARAHAADGAAFEVTSYLEPFGAGRFDAAVMISQDYGVPGPEDRRRLLRNLRAALRPGGRFAFDVPSMAAFEERTRGPLSRWYASGPGFFRPVEHVVLEKAFPYPEIPALCDLYAVLDAGGLTVYRVHQTFFSPESIRAELMENGFRVEAVWASLRGEPYDESSPEMGVLCVRE